MGCNDVPCIYDLIIHNYWMVTYLGTSSSSQYLALMSYIFVVCTCHVVSYTNILQHTRFHGNKPSNQVRSCSNMLSHQTGFCGSSVGYETSIHIHGCYMTDTHVHHASYIEINLVE